MPAATARRRSVNVTGLAAFDLRTLRGDGQPQDFRIPSHRQDALDLIDSLQSTWVSGSPPCTAFCQLNARLNFKNMKPEDVQVMMAQGRLHLPFMCENFQKQGAAGILFLHEHPATAAPRSEECVQTIIGLPDIDFTVSNQCAYGLLTPCSGGVMRPAMKPTKTDVNSSLHA